MMDPELVIELRAVVFYLRLIGVTYPIAPEKAIKTIERVISILSAQLEAPRREIEES